MEDRGKKISEFKASLIYVVIQDSQSYIKILFQNDKGRRALDRRYGTVFSMFESMKLRNGGDFPSLQRRSIGLTFLACTGLLLVQEKSVQLREKIIFS